MPSSSMLEQAIIDANTLREVALKNAQSRILEQYAPQVKEALSQLLEQEEPPAPEDPTAAGMDPAGNGDMGGGLLDISAPPGGTAAPDLTQQTQLGAQEGLKSSCPCKEKDEIVEITLDELNEKPEGEEEGDISGVPIMEDKTVSLDLELIEESLFGEAGDPWQRPEDLHSFLPKKDKFGVRAPEPKPGDDSEMTTIRPTMQPREPEDDGRDLLHDEDGIEEGLFGDDPAWRRQIVPDDMDAYEREQKQRIFQDNVNAAVKRIMRTHPQMDPKQALSIAKQEVKKKLGMAQQSTQRPPKPSLEEAIGSVINETLSVDIDEVRSGWTGTPHPDLHDVALAQSMDDKFQDKFKAMEKSSKQLQNENAQLKTNVQKLSESLKKVISALEEANTVNARLLYGNKVLTNESLNTKQKKEHVAALEKATSMEEAKLIFETLQNAADSNVSNRKEPKSLREAVQYNTPSTLSLMREKLNENKEESDPNFTRMQVLAGIRK